MQASIELNPGICVRRRARRDAIGHDSGGGGGNKAVALPRLTSNPLIAQARLRSGSGAGNDATRAAAGP